MQEQYQSLLDANQFVLDEISDALESRLSEWAHPDARLRLEWRQDPDKSVRLEEPWAHILAGEGAFEGKLARFGHGLQRSYLLALLQELATADATGAPTLILACEEPELYQHPPQARHLAAVLNNISRRNCQVIVSTHNPLFVSGERFEDVRMIRKEPGASRSTATHMQFSEIAHAVANATGEAPVKPEGALAKIHRVLQPSLNEMFFAQRLILVEGLEDEAHLLSYFSLMGKSDEFRRLGCHIVRSNGKSELLQPLVIAKHMRIPTYVMFDADADTPDQNDRRAWHEKDNRSLLTLLDAKTEDPMPKATVWGENFTMWHSDIGSIVEEDIGKQDLISFRQEADQRYGQTGNLHKNVLHIGATLAFAWDAGKRSQNLERVCLRILNARN